jgi:hypothetical protein
MGEAPRYWAGGWDVAA